MYVSKGAHSFRSCSWKISDHFCRFLLECHFCGHILCNTFQKLLILDVFSCIPGEFIAFDGLDLVCATSLGIGEKKRR